MNIHAAIAYAVCLSSNKEICRFLSHLTNKTPFRPSCVPNYLETTALTENVLLCIWSHLPSLTSAKHQERQITYKAAILERSLLQNLTHLSGVVNIGSNDLCWIDEYSIIHRTENRNDAKVLGISIAYKATKKPLCGWHIKQTYISLLFHFNSSSSSLSCGKKATGGQLFLKRFSKLIEKVAAASKCATINKSCSRHLRAAALVLPAWPFLHSS